MTEVKAYKLIECSSCDKVFNCYNACKIENDGYYDVMYCCCNDCVNKHLDSFPNYFTHYMGHLVRVKCTVLNDKVSNRLKQRYVLSKLQERDYV